MVSRGEVWWYEHPNRKRRPVCVLTRNDAVAVLQRVLVVPATTRQRSIRTEVALDHEDGMPRACALSVDNMSVARKSLLTERITTLSPARMLELCEALRVATGC